ncbi:hypothetical protein, partial [Pantoea eucrina]|uniref:hypothetical protein n=1 Tax=Pantoea eucrina TaxID=472693 RepID=UPI002FDA1608
TRLRTERSEVRILLDAPFSAFSPYASVKPVTDSFSTRAVLSKSPRQYQPLSQLTRLCSAILAPPEFTGVNRNADSLLYSVLKNAAFTAIYARFCSMTFF